MAQAAAQADLAGLFCDPHTGVALAVLDKLVKNGTIHHSERVVVISTANGLKFPEFKIRYHDGTLPGIQSTYANQPVELAANYDTVQKAVFG